MIRMKNVTEVYDSSGTVALDGVDLAIEEGEFVFLVGPSGSGKTTLMKLITGEIRPTNGTVIVNDFDMTKIKRRKLPKMRRTLGVVFQDYRLIDNIAWRLHVLLSTHRVCWWRTSRQATWTRFAAWSSCFCLRRSTRWVRPWWS